eukprot:6676009-Pyramimonas_sp.AAC.1
MWHHAIGAHLVEDAGEAHGGEAPHCVQPQLRLGEVLPLVHLRLHVGRVRDHLSAHIMTTNALSTCQSTPSVRCSLGLIQEELQGGKELGLPLSKIRELT